MHDDELRNTVNQLGRALIKFTNETNASFKRLNAKVEETSTKVEETSATVAALGTKVEETSATVAALGTKVEETSATVAALGTKVEETNTAVAKLTKDVTQLIADSKADKIRQAQDDAKFNQALDKIDKVAKLYGNLSNNIGTVAETFFVKALERNKELMGLKFHIVRRNVGTVKEFDIVMLNDEAIIVISVKHILHVRDVEKFVEHDLKKVPILFPEFRSYKLYGGVAGMHINADARILAVDSGLIVLGQAGRNVMVLNAQDFEPRLIK